MEFENCDNTLDYSAMSLSELKEQFFNVEKFYQIAVFTDYEFADGDDVPAEDIRNHMAWGESDTFEDVMNFILQDEELLEEFKNINISQETGVVTIITNPNATI